MFLPDTLFVMIFFNIVNSLLRTTYFDLNQYMETAKYKWDNSLFVLCISLLILVFYISFLKGNIKTFEQGGYLYSYIFQAGVTALLEAVYFIFGIENYLVFQLMNIAAIMVMIGMVNRITGELFGHP